MRDEPSRTAELVCYFRATDQRRRPDERIVDDPYAKLFLGPMMRAALVTLEATGHVGEFAEGLSPGLTAYVLCRHRFIDDALVAALGDDDKSKNGPIRQVVILGAGYDTRAYRLATELAGRTVYELDFPSTSRRKAQIVAEKTSELPSADVRAIEIDFLTERIEERLPAAGFTKGARTFVIWEGVSIYLTRKAVQATLSTLKSLCGRGSIVAMDFGYLLDSVDLLGAAQRMASNLLQLVGEPTTFFIHPEDVGPFFDRLGFDVDDLADSPDLESRYIRDERRVYPGIYVVRARVR
jgi:methyltransferase (TIGR00027 family)